jgi:hypothetical protein
MELRRDKNQIAFQTLEKLPLPVADKLLRRVAGAKRASWTGFLFRHQAEMCRILSSDGIPKPQMNPFDEEFSTN